MSKRTKSVIGLSLFPVVLPFVMLLHLSRRRETCELCAEFWRAVGCDIRQVFNDRHWWGDVVTLLFVVLLGVLAVVNFIAGNWSMAIASLSASTWLSIRG